MTNKHEMIYIFGKRLRVNGVQGRFSKTLNEEEYQQLMNAIDNELPEGILLWKIPESEALDEQETDRIKMIRKMPVIIEDNIFDIHPDPVKHISYLHETQARRERMQNSLKVEQFDLPTFAKIIHYCHDETPLIRIDSDKTESGYDARYKLEVIASFCANLGISVTIADGSFFYPVDAEFCETYASHIEKARNTTAEYIVEVNDSMIGPLHALKPFTSEKKG